MSHDGSYSLVHVGQCHMMDLSLVHVGQCH